MAWAAFDRASGASKTNVGGPQTNGVRGGAPAWKTNNVRGGAGSREGRCGDGTSTSLRPRAAHVLCAERPATALAQAGPFADLRLVARFGAGGASALRVALSG